MFKDDERVLIEDLHAEKSIKNANSKSLARLLASTIYTGFHKPHKFIYEILQNAEDAEAKEISFTLTSNFLVIAYDGLPFKSRDVKRICDVCTHDDSDQNAKPHDLAKIGYKGIGFKSVFCVANKVTVVSNGYQFCFDKKQIEDGYPWQIIPILVERELPQLAYVEQRPVMFILEDFTHPAAELQKEIEKVCRQHESILFLGNIQQVKFVYQHNQLTLRKQRIEVDSVPYEQWETIFHASTDSSIVTFKEPKSWCLYQRQSVFVPQIIRDEMTAFSDAECPQKIKSAEIVDVIFAAEINRETGRLVPNLSSKLYCGLPTEKESGLFFSVNANFLLNQDRTSLLNVAWNTFLLEVIGYHQFNWFASMESERNSRWQSLRLINPQPEALPLQEFLVGYRRGFEQGLYGGQDIPDIAFIPSIDEKLLTVRECIIDETDFFKEFYQVIQDEDLHPVGGNWRLASSQLDCVSLEKLKALFLPNTKSVYRVDDLIEKIEGYVKANRDQLDLLVSIVCFLGNPPKPELNPLDYLERIREKKVFLSIKKNLVSANNGFLPPAEALPKLEEKILQQVEAIEMVHHCYLERSDLFRYTFNLDIFNNINFIKKFILSSVERLRDTNKLEEPFKEHSLLFFESIFLAYWFDRSVFSDIDFNILRAFPVETEGSSRVVRVDSCYLRSQEMDDVYFAGSESIFIANKYYMWESSNEIYAVWQDLLKRMHININVSLEFYHSLSFADLYRRSEADYFKEYVADCVCQKVPKKPGQGAKFHPANNTFNAEQASLSPFVTFPNLNAILYNPQFAQSFLNLLWFAIAKNFDNLSESCRYSAGGTTTKLPQHFLVFCLNNYSMVKVYGQDRYLPTKHLIYSPSLRHIVQGLLPTPELPITLSEEQARFLGFRALPTLKEILSVLRGLSKSQSANTGDVAKLYRLIMQVDDGVEHEKMIEWQKNNVLYSLDGTWQPASTLSVYDAAGSAPKPYSRWVHDVGLRPDDLSKLAGKLALPMASTSKEVRVDSLSEENRETIELKMLVKSKILDSLPAIMMIQNQGFSQIVGAHQENLRAVLSLFKQLKFLRCRDSICVAGRSRYVYLNDQNEVLFYFRTGMRKGQSTFYEELAEALVKYFDFAPKTQKEFRDCMNSDMEHADELKFTGDEQGLYEELKKICEQYRDEILSSQPLMPLHEKNLDEQRADGEKNSDGSQSPTQLLESSECFDVESNVIPVDELDKEFREKVVITDSNVLPSSSVEELPATPPRTPPSAPQPEPYTPPIDLTKLKKAKVTPDTDRFQSSSKEKQIEQTKINKKMGRVGEQKVYERLEAQYRDRYPNCTIQDLQSSEEGKDYPGFSVKGEKEGRKIHLEIVFYNKGLNFSEDREYDHDIAIINYIRGTTRYLEVKTTQNKVDSSHSHHIELTESEYRRMQQAGSRYSIFRVFNPREKEVNSKGEENPVIHKIKGAYQYMECGMLSVKRINVDYKPIQFASASSVGFFSMAIKPKPIQQALLKAVDQCIAKFYQSNCYRPIKPVSVKPLIRDGLDLFDLPQDHGADGDCLFKVIASFVPNATHKSIRELLVEQGLGEHQGILTEAFTADGADIKLVTRNGFPHKVNNIQDYIQLMQQPGTWGGYLDIAILALLLDRPMVILTEGGWPIIFDIDHRLTQDKVPQPPIFIYYNGTDHYQSLCPKEDCFQTLEGLRQLANETGTDLVSVQSRTMGDVATVYT